MQAWRWRARVGVLLVLVLTVLPVLPSSAVPVRAQGAGPVFGLRGTLQPVAGQPYATELIEPDGTRYGVVGATPAIEDELTTLAARREAVKVWGTLQAQSPLRTTPIIVATNVVVDSGLPAATPAETATPRPAPTPMPPLATRPTALPIPTAPPSNLTLAAPTATITVYAAYLREGPGSDFATVGQVSQGTVCDVIARATVPGWLRLRCPGVTGWIREGLYELQGSVVFLPLQTGPMPTATSTPTAPAADWRVAGYANRDLAGAPAAAFITDAINYDWGTASPSAVLPPDNFSLRFDRTLRLTPGLYRFDLRYDDGVRLVLNGQVVINDWNEGAVRSRTWQGTLGGDVGVRLDYFDAYGQALVQLAVTPVQGALPTATLPPPILPEEPPSGAWLAAYYTNATLSGGPAFRRLEPRGPVFPLDADYSFGSPVPGVIGEDGWSARWRGRFYFDTADYRFVARGNDGVRVYIDGIRVLDAWPSATETVSNIFRRVGAGEHEIVVEMFDVSGAAWVRAWWERLNTPTGNLQP